MGIRVAVSRNTLSNANKVCDWCICADLAQSLIPIAQGLYIDEDFGVELDQTVYALDATTIDLCLSVLPWVHFRQIKATIKLHTLLDLRGNIPTFIHISDGKLHDINVLDVLQSPFSSSAPSPISSVASSIPIWSTRPTGCAMIKLLRSLVSIPPKITP
jgi:hypothetical protein